MLAQALLLLAALLQGEGTPPAPEPAGQVRVDEIRTFADANADSSDLYARLAAVADAPPPHAHPVLLRVLRAPWELPSRGKDLAAALDTRTFDEIVFGTPIRDDPDRLAHYWARAGAVLVRAGNQDLAPPGDAPDTPVRPAYAEAASVEAVLDLIEARVTLAHAALARAFGDLTADEREALAAHWDDIGARFEEHIYLHEDPDAERRPRNERTLALAARVDRDALLEAGLVVASGGWAEAARRIGELRSADGAELAASVIAERATPYGRIVVAGTGDDVHADYDVAVLLDLGGDDRYRGAPAATLDANGRPDFTRHGVAVVCDLGGDDAYESTAAGSTAFGCLGVGLLIDAAGDDSYVGLRWTQGAAFLGVGILVDTAGDDVYRAHALAQGTACFGYAALGDYAGNDRYEAHRYAQGVGLAGGAGVLHERGGDDSYYCKGTYQSSYGTDGVFEGWGQGVGIGFRRTAAGGIGVLDDCAGNDRYEAGNFAQGGGYFFGLGCLRDDGDGDDVYVGSRYAQGFSAHQAVGWFRDAGGNDVYETRFAVATGLAWDQSVSWFEDAGGDDRYRGGGFSLGASAHNAIAVFLDRGGRDTYLHDALARSGPNDYHGGSSLSVFLDEGGAEDAYRDPARNGAQRIEGQGLFRDR